MRLARHPIDKNAAHNQHLGTFNPQTPTDDELNELLDELAGDTDEPHANGHKQPRKPAKKKSQSSSPPDPPPS